MKTFLSLSFFIFIVAGGVNAAEIYQWVDENGKVHFGDKPPRNAKATNISSSTKSVNVDSSALEREKVGKIFAPPTPEERAYQQQKQQGVGQTKLQAACAEAQEELRFFQEERFYWVDKEGNSSHATEDERQERIDALKTLIEKNCS